MRNRSLLILLLALSAAAAAQAEQLVIQVLPLGYRSADEVIQIVRPLLAPGGTVTGMSNQLVVKTTPANMAEIKQVLAAVDSAPRRLMISVKQTSSADATRDASSLSGTIGGGNATATVPPPRGARNDPGVSVQSGSTRIQGNTISSRAARNDGVTQNVQVLEGNEAFIRIGQSQAIPTTKVIDTPQGRRVIQSSQYVEADTGFYVTPRVSGERVTLEVNTARDRLSNRGAGGVNTQRVSTVVSGRLGEWMEIGGSSTRIDRSDSEILSRSRDSRSDERRVLLMVEEIK